MAKTWLVQAARDKGNFSYGSSSAREFIAKHPELGRTATVQEVAQKKAIDPKVIEFQKKRAATGEAQAYFDLGLRYANGEGVERSTEEAKTYFEKAAQNANSQYLKKRAEAELDKLGQGGR